MACLLGHVSLGVDDLAASGRFYDAMLGAIGATRLYTMEQAIAWGRKWPEFWIGTPIDDQPAAVGNGTHVAFMATDRGQVDAAYAAGLAAGGSSASPEPCFRNILHALPPQSLARRRLGVTSFAPHAYMRFSEKCGLCQASARPMGARWLGWPRCCSPTSSWARVWRRWFSPLS